MDTNKNWFAYQITVASEASEAVEFGLNELDALGTEINNLGKKPTETLTVVGYFGEPQNEENLRNGLNEALRIYGFAPDAIREIDSRRIGDVDWLFEWKKHWKPTFTEKFVIAPSWENVEDSGKIVVRIEPNMAFGTGTHETTRLCLKAIEENYESGMSFLDVGTGTGILAIAAAKYGRQSNEIDVVLNSFSACDTDFDSIKIAKENAEANEVDGIDFYVGSISEATPKADFVCANITIDILVPLLPLLLEKSEKVLVLSGILKEQQDLIVESLDNFQIADYKIETAGEWVSVTISR
jgi:ribosomal protein L11 methyltransferase